MSGPVSALLSQTAPVGTWGTILPQGISLAQAIVDAETAHLATISSQVQALQAQISTLQVEAQASQQNLTDAQAAVNSMQSTLTLLQNS